MKREIDQLEEELRRLKPRDLTETTREAIRREAALTEPNRPILRGHAFMLDAVRFALKAAAVLAVVAGLAVAYSALRNRGTETGEPGAVASLNGNPAWKASVTNGHEPASPVAVATVLVDARDEGIALDRSGRPMRKFRYTFVDNVCVPHAQREPEVIRRSARENVVLVAAPVN